MAETSIEWVVGPDGSRGHTVNPIRFRNLATGKVGHYCEKIAAGCAHCYSSTMQSPYLSGLEFVASNKDKGELFFEDAVLDQVLRRRKATGFFWCDMTDLFGSWVPDEWIDRCFAVMALTPQHRHYVLTKRGERMPRYWRNPADLRDRWHSAFFDARIFPGDPRRANLGSPSRAAVAEGIAKGWRRLMLPNVWLGVSASTRPDLDAQIEHLRATPAAVRFLSLEPLIADLGTIDLSGIGWVIVGGESGPGARPMDPAWAGSIRNQCIEMNVPFFFKQWGGVHKKRAGRLLDGREWNELPGGSR